MKTQKAIPFVTLLFRDWRNAALRRNHRSYAWTEALSGMPEGGILPIMTYIRGGSARKEYLFQASGIWQGSDFARWSIRKDREICHLGLWKGPTMQRANRRILCLYKVEKTFYFCDWFSFKSAFTLVKRDAKLLKRYVKGVPCVNRRYTKGVLLFVRNGI